MSFDILNLHLADNSPEAGVIEGIVSREHVSPEEAVRRALRGVASTTRTVRPRPPKRRIAQEVEPLTNEELGQLEALGKTFGLVADVPDEEIDRMAASIRRMKREGFSNRA